jgi:hypothetical protein
MKKKEMFSDGRWWRVIVIFIIMACFLAACSPYAGIDIGIPLKVGPVYVNPSIGIGGLL